MSLQDENTPDEKPDKCPPHVKAEIKRGMAMHLREHGDHDWALFRERPDYAQWIGEASGEAGRRKFFRWKKDLKRPTPASRTRPHEGRELNEEQQAWARQEAEAAGQPGALPVPLSPRHIMANGGGALEGFAQLGEKLARGFDDIERVRRIALVDDPDGHKGQAASDPELLLKAGRAERELAHAVTTFFRAYNSIWALETCINELVELLEAELAAQPELLARLLSLIVELVHRHGGVPPKAA